MLKCYYLFNYGHIIKFKAIYLEYRPVIFSFIFISDLNFKYKISIVFKLKQKKAKAYKAKSKSQFNMFI